MLKMCRKCELLNKDECIWPYVIGSNNCVCFKLKKGKDKMGITWKEVLIILAILLMAGIVGEMDYQDELLEHKLYCQNVVDEVHPDYKGIFEESCTFNENKLDNE